MKAGWLAGDNSAVLCAAAVRRRDECQRPESRLAPGSNVCGPGVILTVGVKGAREGARVKIMPVGCPQTAGRASRSGAGLAFGHRLTNSFASGCVVVGESRIEDG